MPIPLQISFRQMAPSPAVEADIRRQVGALERRFDRLVGCRVLFQARHHHHQPPHHFQVRVELRVAGAQLVAETPCRDGDAPEGASAAVHAAFEKALAQLEQHFARRLRRRPLPATLRS